MALYRDGLGFEYEVPPSTVTAFEQKRGQMLRTAIVIKSILLLLALMLIWIF